MLEILKRMLSRILPERLKVIKTFETTPEDWKSAPNSLKIERGEMKAKLAKLQKTVENFQLREESKKKEADLEHIASIKYTKMVNDERELLVPLTKYTKQDVRVLCKYAEENEDVMLGYFYDIYLHRGNIAIICSSLPNGEGRKYRVWEASSINNLVSNSQTIAQQLKAKTLILCRDWKGRWIPDIEVSTPIRGQGMTI